MYQQLIRPEPLFRHLFGDESEASEASEASEGYLVTFTGQQARLTRADAAPNELAEIRQRSFPYPAAARLAAAHLIAEAQLEREAYFGVHLFKRLSNRRTSNAKATVMALWLDEDDGEYPSEGPEPTVIVHSSRSRRHLYWRLTQAVSVEWAVGMNRRLAVWADGDTSKAGLTSVLRVPGTANYKRHPAVDLVHGELTGSGPWEPSVMDQAIPELPVASPRRSPAKPGEPYDGPAVELAPYLASPIIEIIGEIPDSLGVKFALVCPWTHEHSGGDRSGTYIGQRSGGGCWFACNHQHCEGRGWREFREKVRLPRESRRIRISRPGYSGPDMEGRIYEC